MQDRSTRRDAYEVITDRIIAALEAGTALWRRPWNVNTHGALRNAVTGHVYRGVNVPMLSLAASAAGYRYGISTAWLKESESGAAGVDSEYYRTLLPQGSARRHDTPMGTVRTTIANCFIRCPCPTMLRSAR